MYLFPLLILMVNKRLDLSTGTSVGVVVGTVRGWIRGIGPRTRYVRGRASDIWGRSRGVWCWSRGVRRRGRGVRRRCRGVGWRRRGVGRSRMVSGMLRSSVVGSMGIVIFFPEVEINLGDTDSITGNQRVPKYID